MAFEIFKLFGSIFVDTSEANNEMDRAGNNAEILGKKFGDVAKKADNISNGLSSVGKGFSTYVTAPLTALGTASVLAFNAVDDGMDKIITTTGAMGAKAEDLENVYKNVGKTIPDTFDNISSAVGDVSARFDVTGDQLQSMSEDFLKFSRVTGTDVATSVQLVSRAMGDAGIPAEQYKSVLDQLTKASQTSGISIETLTENLTKYGAPMRALGFDTQESIAIFAGWEKAGVNTEIAFSGMKKAISNWSADGKDAREEFKKTLQAIGETPDIATATSMAIEVFGQKAGPDLADAIKGGRFSYEEFLAVIEGSDGTLDNTFDSILDAGDKFQLSFQKMQQAGADLGETILNVLAPMLETAAQKVSDLGEWFSNLDQGQQEFIVKVGMMVAAIGPLLLILGGLAGAVSNVAGLFATGGALNGAIGAASAAFGLGTEGAVGMGASLAALTGPVAIVIAVIGGLAAILAGAWQSSETFRNSVTGAFESLKTATQDAFSRISEALAPALESFQGFATGLTPVLQQIGDFIGTYIVPVVEQFIGSFINGFANIIVAIAPFIAAIGNLLSFIGNFVGMVVAILNGDWAGAWQFAQAMGQNAVDFLVNVFQGLYNWVSLIFQSILDFIVGIWAGIVQRTTETWNGIVTFLQTAWQLIYDNTIGKITELANNISIKWGDMQTDAQNKWDSIKSVIATKVGEIFTNVTGKIKETADDVSAKWQTVKSDSETKWGEIKEAVSQKAVEIFQNVTEKVKQIAEELPSKWQSIKEDAGTKWQEIKETIIEKVQNLPGEIYTIATGMIDQMAKGIADTAENVYKGVSGLVEEVIKRFKEGFGINSPAREMIEIGKYIVLGLIKGLNGNNLMSFVNSMVEDIKAAFSSGNFNIKAAISFLGEGAKDILKAMGIGGATLADLIWPTLSAAITSGFGYRDASETDGVGSTNHEGIDIGAAYGDSVMAAGMGTIIFAGDGGGYGNMVKIDHGDGLVTLYAHLSSILAEVGDVVSAGDVIGLVGSTGNSTGPHLHFGIYEDGVAIDPSQILGYASGTNYATAGLHWVGEKGPELVNFKGGESVFDAEESASLASGITQNVYITSPTPLSPSKIAKETKRAMQELAWDM